MKKFGLKFILVCLLGLCTVGLFACEEKEKMTVNWQTGKNYAFVDDSKASLTGEVEYEKGKVIKFKVEATSVLVKIEAVTIGGNAVSADSDGYYTLTVEKNVSVACTTSTINNIVQSISVTTLPTKTTYYIDEILDTAGMVVEATLFDGSKQVVADYNVIYNNGDAFKLGDTTVTISYTDAFETTVSTTIDVIVEDVTLEEMSVTGTLTTTTYFIGYTLTSIEGLTVELVYSNNERRPVTLTDLTVVYQTEGATSFSAGDTKVTLKYQELEYVIEGLIVREINPFDNIEAELVVEDKTPYLVVKGTLMDVDQAILVIRDSGQLAASAIATLDGTAFKAKLNLTTLSKANTWYDVTIYYNTENYVDVLDSEAINFSSAVIYAAGQRWEFKEYNHTLKVNFSEYTFANVETKMENVEGKPLVTVRGICHNVTNIYLYLGADIYVEGEVTNNEFVVSVDLSTKELAYGEYILEITTAVDGTKMMIPAPSELGEPIIVETTKYLLTRNGTNVAITLQNLELDNKVEILTIDNIPTLVVTGKATTDVKVQFGDDIVDAVVADGKYRAEIDLRNILEIGKGFEVLVSIDNGVTYQALTKVNTTYEGTVDYRLTSAIPGDDKYAQNTYLMQLNNDVINVLYHQGIYNSDNQLYTLVTSLTINEEDKVVFTYPATINTWGALKKGDWIWFANATTTNDVCTRTSSSALTKGIWTIELTTGGDPKYQLVYDGNKQFVRLTEKSGLIVMGGNILATNDISRYSLNAALEVINEQIVLKITGKYYIAPTGEGKYNAHAWYGESVDFDGIINADNTFEYTYIFAADAKVDTLWLHMFDNGTEVKMFGLIEQTKAEATLSTRKVVLEYDNKAIIARVTAIATNEITIDYVNLIEISERAALVVRGTTTATSGYIRLGKESETHLDVDMVISEGSFTITVYLDQFTEASEGTWYDLTIYYGTDSIGLKNTMVEDMTVEVTQGSVTWKLAEWYGDLKVYFSPAA